MTALQLASTDRKCAYCGKAYNARKGHGGSMASKHDAELFPWNGTTGVKTENSHWFQGAFCSDSCYAAAYYEPPQAW